LLSCGVLETCPRMDGVTTFIADVDGGRF